MVSTSFTSTTQSKTLNDYSYNEKHKLGGFSPILIKNEFMKLPINNTFIGLATLLGALVLLFFGYQNTLEFYTQDAKTKAVERISLYQNSLYNELTRFNFLPFVIARDQQLIDWSLKRSDRANLALSDIKQASGANEVYIMDTTGTTLSSSNWQDTDSFVGKNFAFRPYFKQAMQGQKGQFFGIGTLSKKPGFYISTGVREEESDDIIAVTVAKVDLSVLENIWIDAGENIFVTNQDGVVILSSKQPWKYRTLSSLAVSQLENIKTQRQFSNQALKPLADNASIDEDQLSIDQVGYVRQTAPISGTDWDMHYLIPKSQINQLTLGTWAKIGLGLLTIVSLILLLWLLRSSTQLKSSRQESAKLRELNTLLETEIEHRHQVEKELRVAQKNIERASKLAAMGQLSASIIHELGQPLAAMKTYIAGAQLTQDKEGDQSVLPKLDGLVDRMSKISQQLQFFAHDGGATLSNIDIRDALNGALMIISPALKQDQIELLLEFEDQPYWVKGDQIRIEQVLVNLLNNARAAVEHSDVKQIRIRIEAQDQQLMIKVSDTGEGISEEMLQILFDPFYTTKPSGVGLGLGLTISHNIVQELNGTLTAHNNEQSGSTFIITLPLSQDVE